MSTSHLLRVTAAIDHALRRGAQRIILVGWSYGARLSIA
jgi:dienelactone hydrolase